MSKRTWTQGLDATNVRAPRLMTMRDETGKVVAFTADQDATQLIAAAPDMLEALNAAEDLLHRMGMQSSDAYQEIDAAISKATGGAK